MQLITNNKDAFNFSGHPCMGANLPAWWNTLKNSNFDIDAVYLPKTLFITANVLFNSPIQWLENWRFSKAIDQVEIKAPVFILGHPRSGTTLLQYLLSKDPQFNYCTTSQALLPNVYLTMGGVLSKILQKALPEKRPMDNLKMGADMPKEEEFGIANIYSRTMIQAYIFPRQMQKLFDENVLFRNPAIAEEWKKYFLKFCKKIAFTKQDKTLLLKSPNNTARIKQILEVFPDAKFIHIYRNPLKVCLSNERLYEKILPITALQKVSKAEVRNFIFYSYKAMMQQYLDTKALIPNGHLIEIAYEDFTKDPLPYFEKIYAQFYPGKFDSVKSVFEKEWQEYNNYKTNTFQIDKELEQKIKSEWGFAFEAFGYSV
jgi:hypothetical protein